MSGFACDTFLFCSKVLFLFLCTGCGLFAQAVAPNWDRPHYRPAERDELSLQRSVDGPGKTEFSFALPSFERTTSAAVYNSHGKQIRTLWMNRAYDKGKYREVWDGKDDDGHKVPADVYTVKLAYNNVRYTWEGIIGNTESSWSSFRSWDGIVPSFIRSIAFLNGKAYSANGYMEGGYAAAVFDEAAPNSTVNPLTKAVFNTLQAFVFAATDGKLVYFGFQTYTAKPQPMQGVIAFQPSGSYYRFPNGASFPSYPQATATFWNDVVDPPRYIPDVQAIDISPYPSSAVTGLAVERNGRMLATAHGFYQPGAGAGPAVASLNQVRLWDKITGRQIGSFSILNPQGMAFDLRNNLWVISGYGVNDKLFRVTDVGGSNLIDSPLGGLSNPTSVTVSPATGSVFVADGGSSQQVKEFSPDNGHLISSLGNLGGYVSRRVCNATVSNTTFWFDPSPNIGKMHVVGLNSPFVSWISAAENGDLWLGDFTTSRILHFSKSGSEWRYVDRIMYLPWAYNSSVPFSQPTRVFGGPTGFLEFKVDYSVALEPGDPDAHGKPSWELVRNWLPCFINQDPTSDLATQMSAYSFSQNAVIGAVFSEATGDIRTLLRLGETGLLKVKHISPLSGWTAFDEFGNFYSMSVRSVNSRSSVSLKKFGVAGFDADGFPNWYLVGQPIGGYLANHEGGDPVPQSQRATFWPSTGSVIPVFDTEANNDVKPGGLAFHLGGLPLNGAELSWRTMPQKMIPFTDGEGSFPSTDVRGSAQMGINAWAMDRNIFAFQNGNGSPWSCQFYHFRDNGLFVGQFGFQTSSSFLPSKISWKVTGYPQKGMDQPLAPGECMDESQVNGVRVGAEYYIYLGDESYHKGIHRWRVSNLESYGELSGSGQPGHAFELSLAVLH